MCQCISKCFANGGHLACRLWRDLEWCVCHILFKVRVKGNPGEGIVGERKKYTVQFLSDENSLVKNKSREELKTCLLLLINWMLRLYIFLTTPFYQKIKKKKNPSGEYSFFHWEILSLETLISSCLICKVAGISIFYFRVCLHFSQFLLDMAYLKEMEFRHANTFSPWYLVLFLCSQNP